MIYLFTGIKGLCKQSKLKETFGLKRQTLPGPFYWPQSVNKNGNTAVLYLDEWIRINHLCRRKKITPLLPLVPLLWFSVFCVCQTVSRSLTVCPSVCRTWAEAAGHTRPPSSVCGPTLHPFTLLSHHPRRWGFLHSPSHLPSLPCTQPAPCTLLLTCACRRIIICHKIYTPCRLTSLLCVKRHILFPGSSGLWAMTGSAGEKRNEKTEVEVEVMFEATSLLWQLSMQRKNKWSSHRRVVGHVWCVFSDRWLITPSLIRLRI